MYGELENSPRVYNTRTVGRTRTSRIRMFNEDYLEKVFDKIWNLTPCVNLIAWSKEQIADYRLVKNDKKGNVYTPQTGDDYEPAEKIQKLSDENDSKNVLKLDLSKDGESATFKSTIINSKENYKNNAMDYTSNTIETTDNYMDISNEPVKVIASDPSKIGKIKVRDICKMLKPHLVQNVCDASNTSETTDDYMDSSNEPENLIASDPLEFGKIIVCDMSKLIEPHSFQIFCDAFSLKTDKKVKIKPTNIISKKPASLPIKTTKQLQISEIESVYQKYFSKSVLDNIIIIAIILNLISVSNKHNQVRINNAMKIKPEAEKSKQLFDINRMHLRHKKILECKLKEYFLKVITKFAIPNFETAFQMLFLSLLTVIRAIDQPKFKKGRVFKNLVLLLWNSLKNGGLNHVKIFLMLRSKAFRPDCIDLITTIEESRDNDPGLTDRMPIFFMISLNNQKYFQVVINTVTSTCDKYEDLALLIDNAAVQCTINSEFKSSTNLPSSSAVQEVVNLIAPASATQSPLKIDESMQQLLLAKPLKETTTVPENAKPNQKLKSYYKSFSNYITRVSTSNGVSKILVPKGIVTSSPNVPNGSLQTGPTFVTLKPFQSTTIPRSEGSTIYLGDKQLRVYPVNQLKWATTTQNNTLMTPVSTVNKPADIPVKCFAKNCLSAATVMCSTCRAVKYCSINCQQLDWLETHSNMCESLNDARMNHPSTSN